MVSVVRLRSGEWRILLREALDGLFQQPRLRWTLNPNLARDVIDQYAAAGRSIVNDAIAVCVAARRSRLRALRLRSTAPVHDDAGRRRGSFELLCANSPAQPTWVRRL